MDSLGLDKDFHLDDMLAHNHRQQDTYYHEYVRLYLANIALTSQVRELVEEKNKLACRLSRYEDDEGLNSEDKTNERNKRFRRNAHEIERFYKCTVKNCEKSYGSQGSLNQHYKLKHPEIYVALPNVQCTKALQDDRSQSFHEQPPQEQEKATVKSRRRTQRGKQN